MLDGRNDGRVTLPWLPCPINSTLQLWNQAFRIIAFVKLGEGIRFSFRRDVCESGTVNRHLCFFAMGILRLMGFFQSIEQPRFRQDLSDQSRANEFVFRGFGRRSKKGRRAGCVSCWTIAWAMGVGVPIVLAASAIKTGDV